MTIFGRRLLLAGRPPGIFKGGVMIWNKNETLLIPQYLWTGSNQHGDRYKRINSKPIRIAELSVEACSAHIDDLKNLILLGDHLDTPVKYEFTKPQNTISIAVVSAKLLKGLIST